MNLENTKISVSAEPKMNGFIENYQKNYKTETGKGISKSEVILKFMILGIKASKTTALNPKPVLNSTDAQEILTEPTESVTFAQDISQERMFSSDFAQDFIQNKKQKQLEKLENEVFERERYLREQEKLLFEDRKAIIEQLKNSYNTQKTSILTKEFQQFEQKTLQVITNHLTNHHMQISQQSIQNTQKMNELNKNIDLLRKSLNDKINEISLKQNNQVQNNEQNFEQSFKIITELHQTTDKIWQKLTTSSLEDQLVKYAPMFISIINLVQNKQNKQAIQEMNDLKTHLLALKSEGKNSFVKKSGLNNSTFAKKSK